MHPLLQKQDALHKEGTMLLKEVLLPIFEQYGKVTVGGSYVYKLLYHPDLDIDIVHEDVSKDLFAKLSETLIKLPFTSKFQSSDRVQFPHVPQGDRPFGYWLSPEMRYGETVWKMDIWMQKPGWYTGNTNQYEKELMHIDDEKRIAILSLKEALIEQKIYGVGKEFVSVDVYEGVLRGNVKTIDELRSFVKTKV